MRLLLIAFACGLALSASTAAIAADPQATSPTVTAAPEPMAQSTTLPGPEHTDPQATAQNASAAPSSEKLICHHPVHEGTILPQQVCLTKHAWDLIRQREQKNVEDFQRRAYQARMK
jgi:hypothetical protein